MEPIVRLEELALPGPPQAPGPSIDWTIRAGDRWALWGPNGAGKSTLLAVLAGVATPIDGTVRRAPGLRLRRVAQEPGLAPGRTIAEAARDGLAELRALEAELREEERRIAAGTGSLERHAALQEAFERAGGWRAEARLRRELARLLPGRAADAPVDALSSGERRRLALALALAARPELLLLDEPTNGLDVGWRRWLTDRLRRSGTTLVVASHDRALLSTVSTHSARLREGRLEPVALPFDRDRERRGHARRRASKRARRARAEAERLARSADRARRWGTPAAGGAARTLARRSEAAAGTAAEQAVTADAGSEARWTLAPAVPARGPVLRARHLAAPPLADVALALEAGTKVALLGPNGSGKSTLLDLLAGARASSRADAEVWTRPGTALHHWDAKHRGLGDEPVRDALERWVSEGRAANLLALAGLPRGRWRARAEGLSGGERARAAVALILAREPDVLLLDEPETDLDIAGLELLESALAEARVTVVLATHDLRLAEGVCEEAWSLEDGELVAWRGGVEGWAAGRRRREPVAPPAPPPLPPAPDPAATLHALEDERAACEAALEDPLRLGERERDRLERRRSELIEALVEAHDRRLPPPAPRYAAVEGPLRLEADLDAGGAGLRFHGGWPVLPRLRVEQGVAHLVLPEPEGGAWLPWARAAALRAAARLVFTVLYPAALQAPSPPRGAPPPPFERLGARWWVLPREAWEAWEGFSPASRAPGSVAASPRDPGRDRGTRG